MSMHQELKVLKAEVVRELGYSISHFYTMDPFTARDGLQRAFHIVVMNSRLLEAAFPEISSILHREFLNQDYSKSAELNGYDEKLFGLLLTLYSFRETSPSISHFASIHDELMDYLRGFSEFFENYDSENRTWVGLSEW